MSVPTASLLGPLSGRARATPPALGLRGDRFLAPRPRRTPLGSPSAWGVGVVCPHRPTLRVSPRLGCRQ
eukprot:5445967-Pyramimonas_sp.AAC.1